MANTSSYMPTGRRDPSRFEYAMIVELIPAGLTLARSQDHGILRTELGKYLSRKMVGDTGIEPVTPTMSKHQGHTETHVFQGFGSDQGLFKSTEIGSFHGRNMGQTIRYPDPPPIKNAVPLAGWDGVIRGEGDTKTFEKFVAENSPECNAGGCLDV